VALSVGVADTESEREGVALLDGVSEDDGESGSK